MRKFTRLKSHVRHAQHWIIDAEAGTVEQYLRDGRAFVLAQKLRQGTLTSEVVTGFSMGLAELFAE